jgi:predicted O-linked N-acetylglucosamine transferase (SPINDLY family)
LKGLGHPEWIAVTEEDYIKKAVDLASKLPALSKLRAGLRSKMAASALMDEKGFTKKVEAAYREMFIKWCESSR